MLAGIEVKYRRLFSLGIQTMLRLKWQKHIAGIASLCLSVWTLWLSLSQDVDRVPYLHVGIMRLVRFRFVI